MTNAIHVKLEKISLWCACGREPEGRKHEERRRRGGSQEDDDDGDEVDLGERVELVLVRVGRDAERVLDGVGMVYAGDQDQGKRCDPTVSSVVSHACDMWVARWTDR